MHLKRKITTHLHVHTHAHIRKQTIITKTHTPLHTYIHTYTPSHTYTYSYMPIPRSIHPYIHPYTRRHTQRTNTTTHTHTSTYTSNSLYLKCKYGTILSIHAHVWPNLIKPGPIFSNIYVLIMYLPFNLTGRQWSFPTEVRVGSSWYQYTVISCQCLQCKAEWTVQYAPMTLPYAST